MTIKIMINNRSNMANRDLLQGQIPNIFKKVLLIV